IRLFPRSPSPPEYRLSSSRSVLLVLKFAETTPGSVRGRVSAGGVSFHFFVHGHGGLGFTQLFRDYQGEDIARNRKASEDESRWLTLAQSGKIVMIRPLE